MSVGAEADLADVLGRIGRHWGWILSFGVLTVLAGAAAIFWPGETLRVVAIIFGVQLVVSGVFELVEALSPAHGTSGDRWFAGVLGALSILVGVICLRNVFATLFGLALLIGLYWIIHGLLQLFYALADRGMPARGWMIATGALSVVAGIVVVADPVLSLLFLAIMLGVWLVVYGAIMIWVAIRLRSAPSGTVAEAPGSPARGIP